MDFISTLLFVLSQIFFAWGAHPRGKYQDADKTVLFEFKSSKVFVKLTREAGPITVSFKFGNVTIKCKDGDRHFTFNSKDNSFTGPAGIKLYNVKEPKAEKKPA